MITFIYCDQDVPWNNKISIDKDGNYIKKVDIDDDVWIKLNKETNEIVIIATMLKDHDGHYYEPDLEDLGNTFKKDLKLFNRPDLVERMYKAQKELDDLTKIIEDLKVE